MICCWEGGGKLGGGRGLAAAARGWPREEDGGLMGVKVLAGA